MNETLPWYKYFTHKYNKFGFLFSYCCSIKEFMIENISDFYPLKNTLVLRGSSFISTRLGWIEKYLGQKKSFTFFIVFDHEVLCPPFS